MIEQAKSGLDCVQLLCAIELPVDFSRSL